MMGNTGIDNTTAAAATASSANQDASQPAAQLVYVASIPIRWGDMDAFGHVNNTVYFRYMEQARIDWFNDALGSLGDGGSGPVLVNASCTFLRQLHHPGNIEVHIFVGAIGRSSMAISYRLQRSDDPGAVVAEGAAKVVWVGFADGKSRALPRHIRDRLPGGARSEAPLTR